MTSLPHLPLLSTLSLKTRYSAAPGPLHWWFPCTYSGLHSCIASRGKSSQKPAGCTSPVQWFAPLSSLAHSPLRVLGIRLQDHVLALLVDVNAHGVCGEPDGVCAQLRVLQDITDHAAFAAFGPLHDWSGEEVRVQPGSAQLHPLEASLPSLSLRVVPGPGWPLSTALKWFYVDMDTGVK